MASMHEFRMLDHVYAANPALGADVLVPPGDDMAMIRTGRNTVLATVDQVVEGRHFTAGTPVQQIGHKVVARSASDLAAMAVEPVGALVAVTLPPDFGEERALAMFDAMRATGDRLNCPLIGGDIAMHAEPGRPLVCAVTILGRLPDGLDAPITRGGAQAGDQVYVTGELGGSFESGRHLDVHPRISEAIALARQLGDRLHAMIDLSDGLGRDVGHIAARSEVGIRIEADALPCAAGSDWRAAMGDGEDYELCFCAAGAVADSIEGLAITAVGEVCDRDTLPAAVTVMADGQPIDASELGWQHGADA